MKTGNFYLVQMQTRNSQQAPSAPVVVERKDLVRFINENLNDDTILLISSVANYE